jgi:hypothetical protein
LPPHSGAWGLPLIHHVSDTMEWKIMEWQTLYFYVHDYIHSWKNCYANYRIDPNGNSSLILYEEDKFYTIKFCHSDILADMEASQFLCLWWSYSIR